MRHSATSNHRHFAHKNLHAKSQSRQIANFSLFIMSAIIAAGIVAAIITTNRINIFSGGVPQVGILAPELRVTNTPHDDICGSGIDDYNFGGTNNIKGFFDHGIMGNDCIARQMNSGVERGDLRGF